MQFSMRLTVILAIVLSVVSCNSQVPPTKLVFQEVGWTLYIPPTSQLLNTAQFDTLKRFAEKAIDNAYGENDALNGVRPLFTITEKQYNIFGSTINLYDSTMFKTWQESYHASKQLIIDLLNKQGDEIMVVDTSTSTEQIDGLQFERFYLKTSYPSQNVTMHTYWFYRKQGVYDFSINVSYTDERIGKQYLDIVRKSKFSK